MNGEPCIQAQQMHRTFGCMGSAQGQFNGPCGVDDDGDILVVDGKKQQNIAFRSPHGMESSLLQ